LRVQSSRVVGASCRRWGVSWLILLRLGWLRSNIDWGSFWNLESHLLALASGMDLIIMSDAIHQGVMSG